MFLQRELLETQTTSVPHYSAVMRLACPNVVWYQQGQVPWKALGREAMYMEEFDRTLAVALCHVSLSLPPENMAIPIALLKIAILTTCQDSGSGCKIQMYNTLATVQQLTKKSLIFGD